jgi:hypothetical protein
VPSSYGLGAHADGPQCGPEPYVLTLPTTITATGFNTLPASWTNFWTTTPATSATITVNVWTSWNTAYEENEEQRVERERRLVEHRAWVERRARELELADERAAQLLDSLLTDAQRKTWREQRVIDIHKRGGRWYRLRHGVSGNISLLDRHGNTRATLCVHPRGDIPVLDVVAGQLLAIRFNEEEFLGKANLHYGEWAPAEQEIRARWRAEHHRVIGEPDRFMQGARFVAA